MNSVIWGTCFFDGKKTNCTVSAPFTGVGNGGTITLLVSYPGNGPTPLTATSISPDNNQIYLTFAQVNEAKERERIRSLLSF